ncbi:hypothetical protein [Sulfitobacter sp.]|uniref:hypothetical protein n=1 Tax=Sulfitobacter sp. TaxID=1903071 RepID=UPI003EF20547
MDCANHTPATLPQTFGRLGPRNELTGIAPDGTPYNDALVQKTFTQALDQMRDNSDREDGTAALDLDCVYGDGNEASSFLFSIIPTTTASCYSAPNKTIVISRETATARH